MIRVHFIILFIYSTLLLVAQNVPSANYEMKDGEVTLTFHKDCLDDTSDDCAPIHDFDEYNLKKVIDKNEKNWSQNGWSLQYLKNGYCKLTKHVQAFNSVFNWNDKYNINSDFWHSPQSENNIKEKNNYKKVTFKLKGHDKAKHVYLAGTFNNWKPADILMTKENNEWVYSLNLQDGIYEYKFVVDDEWMHDPLNPFTVENQHSTLNSILNVGDVYQFELKGYKKAKKIILAASFNNWNETSSSFTKTKDGWILKLNVPKGKHYYKFIVDGQWILDPNNKLQQEDGRGFTNSVLLIN